MTKELFAKRILKYNKEKAEKSLGDYNNRPKYGGMVYGSSAKQWDRLYDVDPLNLTRLHRPFEGQRYISVKYSKI